MPTNSLTEQYCSLKHPDEQPYTARLAGAASLRRELESLLAVAPPTTSTSTLRELVLRSNVVGKKSASATLLVWERLKVRYILDPKVREYGAFTAALNTATGPEDRGLICFLILARTDRLFREVTLECASPHLQKEGTVIEPTKVQAAIQSRLYGNGLSWSTSTLARAQSHLLAALKDFGILRGSRIKRTNIPKPSPAAILFALRLGRLEGLTDRQLIDSVWFRLLGFEHDRMVDLLYSAARAGTLGFRMQADVVEIDLPPLKKEVI